MMTGENVRWQPITIIIRNGGRLECTCGSLAVIAIGDIDTHDNILLKDVDYWCQSCYLKAAEDA